MLKGEFKLGWVFERRGLVCFLEQRNSSDPGMDDLISIGTTTNFGDPSGQRHVGGRRDTHTTDKVLTHGQTLLFYR